MVKIYLKRLIDLLILLLVLLLSACGANGAVDNQSLSVPAYQIDTVFEEFHEFLGGTERLGHPISPLIVEGLSQKQYFEAALLQFSLSAPPSERYSLAPLGLEMGQSDAPLPKPNLPDVLFVNGYIIYAGFIDLFHELGGQRYVGLPITGVRYSESQNRVEQYFENLGFFINLNDAQPKVQLMPFGRSACQESCANLVASPLAIIHTDLPYGEPFIGTAAALGDELLGPRIAGPYQTSQGFLEVIYENMVLFAVLDSQMAKPKPIASQIGLLPTPLVERLNNPNLIFYAIEGQLGHNIPLLFSEYIVVHGGFEISGIPISELELQDDGSARQCFSNLCLSYTPALVTRIVPLALGLEYKRRFYDQPNPQAFDEDLDIQIQLWEDHARITSAQQQIIHASLYAGEQLLAGMQPSLRLYLPNGSESLFHFPPTDQSGHTQLTIPAISAQNGTLIPYELCVEAPNIEKTCATDSYLIWGN